MPPLPRRPCRRPVQAATLLRVTRLVGPQRDRGNDAGGGHMCGIAGVRRFDSEPVSRELLANMAARLLHRGPDDTGIWTQGDVGLRGQFAYAIHDSASGETHLFRDRLGILPLYYYVNNDVFAFASEINNPGKVPLEIIEVQSGSYLG